MRPRGSTATFAAAQNAGIPGMTSDTPVSTYATVPTESRHAYPENAAVAKTVESTGQSERVICVGALAHTVPMAYGTRNVTCFADAATTPPVASTIRRSDNAALTAVRETN